ncbi:MAG: immune inhibitor A [Ignavibacteriales bacterium]|nr:immune inhibitor A [Ignavibacteriales bacterium]
MKNLRLLFLFLLISTVGFSQNYKQVKIYFNDASQLNQLMSSGLEIDHAKFTKDNAIVVFLSDEEFAKLQNTSFTYEILINDWAKYYSELPKLNETEKQSFIQQSKKDYNVDGFGFGSMGGFYTLAEIYSKLDSMYLLYPNLITQKFQIGTSIEGRPMYAVKISDNPNVIESEPQVHFNALIHAREPAAMMAVMYYMYYLLENYGTDPEATYLVDNREIYFIPCINVDGYEYNRQTDPNGGGMWRKNRKNNGTGCWGVDLNRNFSYKWAYNNSGSSSNSCDETYRGSSAFSEPETQAIRDFVEAHNFKTTFNYHTYSNLLLYPWGYINQPTPDDDIFVEFANDIVQYNGYQPGQPPAILYDVNGSADDWFYGEQTTKDKIFAYTPEVGSTGFWPSMSEIFPLAMENLKPNLYLTWAAGEFVNMENISFSDDYFDAGDNIEVSIGSVRNKGLSDAFSTSINLSSPDPNVIVTNGTINLGDIASRTTIFPTGTLSFSLSNSLVPNVTIPLLFTVSTGSTIMFVDTIKVVSGTPVFAFVDTTNNPLTLWTITATPSNKKWEATTTSYHSAPNSYTDSKNGDYNDNATVTMQLTNSIDISSLTNPRASFWTKYDIENGWDYGQFEVSTNNGSTWTPLEGLYTNPGTGSFQPNGEPLYDGVQSAWVKEDIDLTGHTSNQFKMRFQLKTDGGVTGDGWYVDDISIFVYGVVPVELTSFNAKSTNKEITLNWQTATELNNNGFEIERLTNANSGWTRIGFVMGNGTTQEIHNYSFVDKNPVSGINYYRLKQIDYDGTVNLSQEVSVNFVGVIEYSLEQNYPNPFNPSTKIYYSIPQAGKVTIKVYNILGSEVATLVDDVKDSGRHNVEFNSEGKNITSGIYFYTITAGSFKQTRKMLMIK